MPQTYKDLPESDDQYPDGKENCCNNQSTPLSPDIAPDRQREI